MDIIIVDDEELIRTGLESLPWASIGVKVAGTAASAEEALALIRKRKPQIVLSDIKMKDKNGIELAGILKTELPRVKVILITGYKRFDYAVAAIQAGVFGFILKPTSPDEILDTVKRARGALLYEFSSAEPDESAGDVPVKKSVRDAIEYINAHYAEDIGLADIAGHVHAAPAYLSRLFREALDDTVTSVITRVRMREACELLKNPDYSVAEVSARVGIPDAGYFSQVFKKAYDMTPKEMRSKVFGQG